MQKIIRKKLRKRKVAKETYSVKEIIQEFRKEVGESFKEVHNRLDVANGRVKKLEMWKQFLLGAWAVITVVTPISYYFLLKEVGDFEDNLDIKIKDGISQALKENVAEIKYEKQ